MNKWTQRSQISLRRWGRRHMYRKGKERHQTCGMESYESLKYELSGENVWPLLLFEDVRLWIPSWKKPFRMEKLGKKRCLRLESNWKITFLETWSHWYFILLLHRGIFEESWLGSIQHKGGRDSNWSLHWDVCCSYIIYWKIEKVLGVVPWF